MKYETIDVRTAAAYVRVSDDRQDEYSPDSQLKLIREHAKRNGYIVPDEYVFYDDGISAKSSEKRTQFREMIAMAKDKDKPFDMIYVWKFSRFARNQEESIVYKSLLKKNGVSVVSISEPITDSPFGSLIERIIEWMDEYYLTRLSGEVKRGMKEKASRGEAMSRQFGYDIKDKILVPNEQAEIVKDVFEMYASGVGMRTIAMMLSEKGIRTHLGNKIDNRFIEYMLNNPVYIGKIRWSEDGRVASRRLYKDNRILISEGKHQPIIPKELWDKVQAKLQEQEKKYAKYERREAVKNYMLKGLVRCSACSSTLCMQSVGNGGTLQCNSYSRGRCSVSHSILLKSANKAVIDALIHAVNTMNFSISPERINQLGEEGPDYSALIQAEEKKLKRIADAYEQGIDTLEEYKQKKKKINTAIETLKKKAEEIVIKTIDPEDLCKKTKEAITLLQDPDVTEEEKNSILRTVVERVVFHRPTGEMRVYFRV